MSQPSYKDVMFEDFKLPDEEIARMWEAKLPASIIAVEMRASLTTAYRVIQRLIDEGKVTRPLFRKGGDWYGKVTD